MFGVPSNGALRFPFDLRHDALNQIGRAETAPRVVVNAEAVQGERFLEALVQTVGRRFIESAQLFSQLVQGAFGIRIAAVRPRPLSTRRQLRRDQVGHNRPKPLAAEVLNERADHVANSRSKHPPMTEVSSRLGRLACVNLHPESSHTHHPG